MHRLVLHSGSHEVRGCRPTMEDTHVSFTEMPSQIKSQNELHRFGYFGVYDGHGGSETATYLEKNYI